MKLYLEKKKEVKMERIKLFSKPEIERVKLFSSNRVKLFAEPELQTTKEVICMDCGFKMETTSTTTNLICPKCGGSRFEIEKEFSGEDLDIEFQKYFSTPENDLEEKLKKYSGKTITKKEYERQFSGLDLGNYIESGESNVRIDENAYLFSKLFSSISITITKELDLDPAIVCNSKCNKESIINRLEDSENMSPKCIMLIKKAHNISNEEKDREWVVDSGIVNDLGAEFNGQTREMPDFKTILETRYPDAPENIVEILKNSGAINIEDGRVRIL